MSLQYTKKFFDLVKDLSGINPSIIFEKDEDGNILVKRANASQTIIYTLKANKSNFEFESEDVAFYNYPEFHQLISVFKEPILNEDNDKLIISEGKSKIKYKVSDAEVINRIKGKSKFSEPDVEFSISADQLSKIKKMIGLISAEQIKFKVKKSSEIECVFFNGEHSNNWEETYAVSKESESEFDLVINARVFTLIPVNGYKLAIKKEGITQLKYISDDFDLEILVPEDTQ
jgi:hypothetical protein